MEKLIQDMINHTDLWPWYFISYGEKEYAFAVVEAYPVSDSVKIPEPGSELFMDDDGNWCDDQGNEMIIETEIANIENQNGDVICKFIAGCHGHFLKNYLDANN